MLYFKDTDDMLDKTFQMAIGYADIQQNEFGYDHKEYVRQIISTVESIRTYFLDEYVRGNIAFANTSSLNELEQVRQRNVARRVLTSGKND